MWGPPGRSVTPWSGPPAQHPPCPTGGGSVADGDGQEDGLAAAGVAPPEDDGGTADDAAQEGSMETTGAAPPEDDGGAADDDAQEGGMEATGVAPPEDDGEGAAGDDTGPSAPQMPTALHRPAGLRSCQAAGKATQARRRLAAEQAGPCPGPGGRRTGGPGAGDPDRSAGGPGSGQGGRRRGGFGTGGPDPSAGGPGSGQGGRRTGGQA